MEPHEPTMDTSNRKWILALSENTEALNSLNDYLVGLENHAMQASMNPNATEITWRSCQMYCKIAQDMRVFIHTTLSEHKQSQERNSQDHESDGMSVHAGYRFE